MWVASCQPSFLLQVYTESLVCATLCAVLSVGYMDLHSYTTNRGWSLGSSPFFVNPSICGRYTKQNVHLLSSMQSTR